MSSKNKIYSCCSDIRALAAGKYEPDWLATPISSARVSIDLCPPGLRGYGSGAGALSSSFSSDVIRTRIVSASAKSESHSSTYFFSVAKDPPSSSTLISCALARAWDKYINWSLASSRRDTFPSTTLNLARKTSKVSRLTFYAPRAILLSLSPLASTSIRLQRTTSESVFRLRSASLMAFSLFT